MKKVLVLMIVALFAFGAVACGDDDDGGGGPCDDLADAYQAAMDEVCGDYPDCSLCEAAEEGEGEEPTDEECQEALDAFDHDTTVEGFVALCELEEGM